MSLDRRHRHRRLRRRALAGAATQPREDPRPHRHRPHGGDPRHLRPERSLPRGPGPGRAGALAVPSATTPRQGPAFASRPVASAPGARVRRSSRSIDAAWSGRMTRLEADLHAARPAPVAPSAGRADRGQLRRCPWSATPTPASRPAQPRCTARTCSSRTDSSPPSIPDPPPRPPRRRDGPVVRHRRVRPQASPPAGRGLPLDPRGGQGVPTCSSTSWTRRPRTPRARSTRFGPCSHEIGADSVPELPRVNKAEPWPPGEQAAEEARRLRRTHRGSVIVAAVTRRGSRRAAGRRGRRPPAGPTAAVDLGIPYDRGDILAAAPVRRGEIPARRPAASWPSGPVLDEGPGAGSRAFTVGRA